LSWKTILKTITYEWLIEYDGRPILLADLGNEKVLFYKRTGSGGEGKEGDAQAGGFAPFFGFSFLNRYVYWFIKGYPDRYGGYKKEAQWLDSNVKEIPTDLPNMGLYEANKFFRNKGATLGRPEYDKMGYKVFYEPPLVMVVVGNKINYPIKSNFQKVKLEYEYFKKNKKFPELTETYEQLDKILNKLENMKFPEIIIKAKKYSGDVLQPKKKKFLLKYVEVINSLREKLKIEYNKFLKVWEDWKEDFKEIDFTPLQYKEMSIFEANAREDLI